MILPLILAALTLTPEAPVAPEVIRNAPHLQMRPAVASNGTEFFAAWEHNQIAFSHDDVLGTRIGANGEVLDRQGGITLQPMWEADRDPSVAWNGSTYGVAIAEGSLGHFYGIKAVEVTPEGLVVNEKLVVTPRDVTFVDLAWNGSVYLLVWRQGDDGSVRAQKLDRAFANVGDELVLAASGAVDVAVASNGADFLVAWFTARGAFASRVTDVVSPPVDVTAEAKSVDVASNGTSYAVFAGGGEIVAIDHTVTGRVAIANSSEGVIAWNGARWIAAWNTADRVYVAELDAALSFTRAPERLVVEESVQRTPAIASSASRTIVLWSDEADIRSAFVGNPSTTSLVSQGLTNQRTGDAAWSAQALGVVWHEGDALRFGRFSRDGAMLDGEGLALAGATSARIASNGTSWAIAAERSRSIEVEFLPGRTFVLGAGELPRIGSNGRDYYVAWHSGLGEVRGRAVFADGTLGPERILVPAGQFGSSMVDGIAWNGSEYLVLATRVGGFRLNLFTFVATRVNADGEVGSSVTIASGMTYAWSGARILETQGEPLIVWSVKDAGVRAKHGLGGAEFIVDASATGLHAAAWDGRELIIVIDRNSQPVLLRGNEPTILDLPLPFVLAAAPGRRPALLYHRTFERIPGYPAQRLDRAFLRFVLPEIRRRATRH